jgi:ABC-2 type transport system permease protein
MNAISHTLAITRKEIQLIVRGGGALALFFLLPLLLGVVMGGANLAANPEGEATILLHVGLVNQDGGAFGREIASALETISALQVQRFDATGAAEAQVGKGEAAAAIVIPAGFSAQIEAHTPTAIDVIVDPGQPQSASIVAGIMNQVVSEAAIWGEVQYGIRTFMADAGAPKNITAEQRRAVEAQNLGVIMTVLNEMRRTPVIGVVTEDMTGTVIKPTMQQFIALLFAGFAVMFIFINVSWSAGSLLEEREAGALRRLLAAPIPRGAIIAGKALAFVLLSCAQVVVLFGVAAAFFRIPLGRSPAALIVLTLVVGLASASLGMLVAAVARSANQASNIGVILGLVLAGLGGAFTMSNVPAVRLAGFVSALANLTPQGHAINGFYSVMAENAGLLQVLPQIGILLAASVVFFVIATWRLRFEA